MYGSIDGWMHINCWWAKRERLVPVCSAFYRCSSIDFTLFVKEKVHYIVPPPEPYRRTPSMGYCILLFLPDNPAPRRPYRSHAHPSPSVYTTLYQAKSLVYSSNLKLHTQLLCTLLDGVTPLFGIAYQGLHFLRLEHFLQHGILVKVTL